MESTVEQLNIELFCMSIPHLRQLTRPSRSHHVFVAHDMTDSLTKGPFHLSTYSIAVLFELDLEIKCSNKLKACKDKTSSLVTINFVFSEVSRLQSPEDRDHLFPQCLSANRLGTPLASILLHSMITTPS